MSHGVGERSMELVIEGRSKLSFDDRQRSV